ncbi:MAG: alpha-xylosidase [Clostridia bacterium]|nr:alpha-xylosidase [Clostridia bacterium]
MKFRLGHWLLKPEMEATYAVEAFRIKREADAVNILAPSSQVFNRGCTLTAALNVRLSSPMPGVIRVDAVHFKGQTKNAPEFEIETQETNVQITETEDALFFTSGNLTCRVDRTGGHWGLEFLSDGQRLTGTTDRSLAWMRDRNTGRAYMTEQLCLDVGECIYGLGERFGPFVKNGQVVEMWQGDGGSCSELAYKNVPLYLSNKGYGVFVNNPGDVAFEIASEDVEKVEIAVEDEKISYFVIAGPTPKDVLTRYTQMLGRPALPPAWSFGLWLSTSFTTNYDENTVTSFISGMADRRIPLSVFHFDCFWMKGFEWVNFTWDDETFPDPKGMLERYKSRGLHICAWINPYVAQNSCLFDEAMEKGFLIKKTNGDVWQTDLWQAGMGIVDFTNPGAWKWYQDKLRGLLSDGVDCIKTDFGERIPVKDIKYFDGSDPVRMHNYYSYLYNKCVFELLEEVRGKGEAIVFARSGTAGSQKFPCHWGGDNSATYVSMAETLRAGLSLSSSGFGFWSHDISGFESTAPAHVYKRWCQFGLLSSQSRLHGSNSYRVPWLFDEEACDVLRKFVNLKCTLMPYLYQKAVEAHKTGVPMMRPMFMEFPDDPACDMLDRQYMLGDSILVAPIFREDGSVQYYLPDGRWTHLIDGRVVEGGRWMKETYDFMSLPVWVRENTALPIGNRDDKPDYDYADNVTIRLYHIKEGADIHVAIPDTKGNTALTVRVQKKMGEIKVTGDKGEVNYIISAE